MKLKDTQPDNPQVLAFNEIFSSGDETLQAKALLDFVTQNPDLKDGSRGKSRGGQIDLTVYLKREGVRDVSDGVAQSPFLDWEIFAKKMEHKRGWNVSKAM